MSVDALVLLADGTRRRLGDIRVGDQVVTRTGEPAEVQAVHEQGQLDTVRITAASGREVIAAPDHPFWTAQGWVKAGDLQPGDVLAEVLRPDVTAGATQTKDDFQRAARSAIDAVPEFVFRGDLDRIGAFLSRFFAGEDDRDGPRELLEGVHHLLLRIGVRARLAPAPDGSWRLTQLSGDDGGPLAPDPVVSVAPAGLHECRCLTVADDHTFTVNDLVVHNTTLANIVAAELGSGIRTTSGPVIERSGDLAAILTSLTEGDVLFIDEIHRIAKPAEELLYSAMEDFRVDVIVGKGPGATAIPIDVEPFTLVGATTRAGLLSGPMRDRFGFVAHLDFYSPADLDALLHRSARILGVPITPEGAAEIAGRSRGTPRIANRLLRRVRDYAEVRGDGVVNEETAKAALTVYDVDQLGLDRLDRAVLRALIESFRGGPVGLSTLAVAVGEQSDTVEEMCEPFLVRAGLLARTPRGRVATDAGWRHLGKTPPEGKGAPVQQPDLFTRAEDPGNAASP
nr:Holliday junction branch migration DNA helicase RuvB [Actinoplanes sp. TFC3]